MDHQQRRMWHALLRPWTERPACELEAARIYTRRYPRHWGGWAVLAAGLAGVARYKDGHKALQRSGRLVPRSLRFYLAAQWGHFYREMRQEKRAENWYRKAVALKSNTATHLYLGSCLARQGRFAEAKRQHLRAIRLATDPKYDAPDEAYLNLGLILRAEGKYKEAAGKFRKAIRLDRKYRVAREALRDVELAARLRKNERPGT